MPTEPKERNLIYNQHGFVTAATQPKSFAATIIPWAICVVGATFYIYEYLLRVAPSVMTADLMSSFHIGAAAFGNSVAFYYYIYMPMQLIVGLLMDRYGPRRLFTVAGLSCGLGAYLFASASTLGMAEVGRFLVGLGSAFGFVGVLKLATIWLPPERFAVVAGLTSALGTLGGILANALTPLVDHEGWRLTSYWAAVFGLALTLVMFLVIRDGGKYQYRPVTLEVPQPRIDFAALFKGLFSIIKNPQMWIVGIIGCLTYVTNSAFAEMWGNPYLRQVYHFTPDQAGKAISASFLGWVIGGPLAGYYSNRIRQRRLPITMGATAAAVAIAVVIYVPSIPAWGVYAALFLFGFFSSAHVIVFAISREISPLQSAGIAIALTNMFTMISGALFQPLIGKILDFHWTGEIVNGVRVYTTGNYQLALSVLPLAMLLTVFLAMFMNETYCQQIKADN